MLTKTNQADLPNVFDQQKEHDQLNHIKEEIGALAKKLVANGKEVLAQKGFSKEQQDIFEEMFQKCFVSTADTTTKLLPNEETYVFTGDIEAMWLRDSSAQVVHYLPFAKTVPQIGRMIYGLIKRQMRYIGIDPYANAFNEEANGHCWEKDDTDSNDWEWERKYEIDSLCYPLWLLHAYYEKTQDARVFSAETKTAFRRILDTWKTEQRHDVDSSYYFRRVNCPPTDTLSNNGNGEPTAYTGMTWSGFRPSDDACRYGYLVPSNMFASVVLGYLAEYASSQYKDDAMAKEALDLKNQIEDGIEAYAVRNVDGIGETYVYETDGYGHDVWMDDANVPNLLSMPWLGWCSPDDERYQNTRKWVLSSKNPFYYEGTAAKGIGSPHTPAGYIWHIALAMQGLTSADENEKTQLMKTLLTTDAGKRLMHEGFDSNDPEKFTRDWFAWANSLFALYAMEYCEL